MTTVDVYDMDKNRVETLGLSSDVFEAPVKEDLMQLIVRWQLASARAGTASTKTRGEVSGGGRKPWKQKHSGRARHGSTRSPIWRKGGVAFGPKPRDWSFSVPRKVRKQALRSALSFKFREGSLQIVKDLEVEEIKTKRVARMLDAFGVSSALFVGAAGPEQQNFVKSARNISGVKVIADKGINVYDTLKFGSLIMTVDAAKSVQEALAL